MTSEFKGRRMQLIFCLIILVSIGLYMLRNVEERPIAVVSNEIAMNEKGISFDNNPIVKQTLDIFHADRQVKAIYIKFGGEWKEEDSVEAKLEFDRGGEIYSQNIEVNYGNIDNSGWCKLTFDFTTIETPAELILSVRNTENSISICTAKDLDGYGICYINGMPYDDVLMLRVELSINNIIWDKLYRILIPLYMISSIGIVLFFYYRKEEIKSGRILFAGSVCLNMLCIVIMLPYFAKIPQVAENVMNYYYLTAENSTLQCLFMTDAGYLPLVQRLIAIVCIKVLHLGTNALWLMQAIGMAADICWASSICLYLYRKLASNIVRFGVSLLVMVLFADPLVSTFFNFIYLGYFFILLLISADLRELRRWEYIFACSVSAAICLSKALYIVFFPVGVAAIFLFDKQLERRKKTYIIVIATAALGQVISAAVLGGLNNWIGLNLTLRAVICMAFLVVILIAISCRYLPALGKQILKNCGEQGMIAVFLLVCMAGSFLIPTVVKGLDGTAMVSLDYMIYIFNWANAWYIPFLLCFMIFMLWIMANKKVYVQFGCYIIIAVYMMISMVFTNVKGRINYNCVGWDVYREYFEDTIVPIFRNDERFGTQAKGLTLYYIGDLPGHDYEFEVPYDMIKLDQKANADFVNMFFLPYSLAANNTSTVYVNYLNDVGNKELFLECIDKDGNIMLREKQITPVSSKTVGFIFDEISEVSSMRITYENGRDAYVENRIIIVQEKVD